MQDLYEQYSEACLLYRKFLFQEDPEVDDASTPMADEHFSKIFKIHTEIFSKGGKPALKELSDFLKQNSKCKKIYLFYIIMGTSDSKYRKDFLGPYAKDFKFNKIQDPALQYRTRFLHGIIIEKMYPGDNLMKTAIAKYYVMLDRLADYDLASRKEELEMVPRRLLDEKFVQFLTMELWSTNGHPGHKPLVDIIGSMPIVDYN